MSQREDERRDEPAWAVQAPAHDAASERRLVERLREGDERAYEELVRDHAGRMLSVARRIVTNDEDARDVVQEAFVSAFRGIGRFEGDARVSTWLHRIVVNVALMRLRTRRRKPEAQIDTLLPAYREDGHHVTQFTRWTVAADEMLVREELRVAVREAIAQLPEAYRTVIIMRDFEDLDTEETAHALGITPNAAKIRLHRARQALRTLIDPCFRRTDS